MDEVRASDNIRLIAMYEIFRDEVDGWWFARFDWRWWREPAVSESALRYRVEHADPNTPEDTMRVYRSALNAIDAAKAGAK